MDSTKRRTSEASHFFLLRENLTVSDCLPLARCCSQVNHDWPAVACERGKAEVALVCASHLGGSDVVAMDLFVNSSVSERIHCPRAAGTGS